ncbi:MAG: 3-isopropylmalate dehydratase small subunit [bacterium]
MVLRGRAWKYGKNVDTDVIIPGRYANISEPDELAKHCLEDLDPDFAQKVKSGDMIVAETNFGCGSSREIAPLAIKAAGASSVIAKSFARIFYRNAINIGLPIFECPKAVDNIEDGDQVEVDPAAGTIVNLSKNLSFRTELFPDFIERIVAEGGLMRYVASRLSNM